MRDARHAGSTTRRPILETTGGRNGRIGALHVDVPRRVHRRSERRTGQPRRRRLRVEQVDHWGGDHHQGVPIFVPSHRPPGPSVANYPLATYVTDGIASAMAQAKAAAGDRNVVVQGAYTAQRALEAGVLDEVQIHQVPVLFGRGRRLFEVLPSPAAPQPAPRQPAGAVRCRRPSAWASSIPSVRPVKISSFAVARPTRGVSRAGPTGAPSRPPAMRGRRVPQSPARCAPAAGRGAGPRCPRRTARAAGPPSRRGSIR
jgi:hypothetical protein